MTVKSVGRIDPNQPITPKGTTPFVTSTGVQIGAFYTTTQKHVLTADEEFWQGVLLGIEPEWSRRRIAHYICYMILVGTLAFVAFWKAKETMQ